LYAPLKLPDQGSKAKVRFLAQAEPKVDPETNQQIIEEGVRYVQTLYHHSKFKVMDERCLAEEDAADPMACPLCRVQAPRTAKTYLPVRERGDTQQDRVKWFVIGREALQTLISVLGVIPNGDLTGIDFIIMREGVQLKTRYGFYPQNDTTRPLDAKELALQFPNPDDMIPMKTAEELESVALNWERAQHATPTGGGATATTGGDEEVPF
jgi:hypothetical protein